MKSAAVDLHASLRTGVASRLGAGDPLWDVAAKPVHIRTENVRELADLVHLYPMPGTFSRSGEKL